MVKTKAGLNFPPVSRGAILIDPPQQLQLSVPKLELLVFSDPGWWARCPATVTLFEP